MELALGACRGAGKGMLTHRLWLGSGGAGTCASAGVGKGFHRALSSEWVAMEMCGGEGSMGISGIAVLPSPFTWAWLASWQLPQ